MNDRLTFESEPFAESTELESFETLDMEAPGPWESETNANSPQYVRWIQESLSKILGLQLRGDGIMGQQTRSAIRSFQQKNGLVADGILGPKTEAALVSTGAPYPPNSVAGGILMTPGSTPVGSTVRQNFENYARSEQWREAFLNLNGLNMNEMLRSLESIGPETRETLWIRRVLFAGLVNMPRIEFAMTVVANRMLPDIVPLDLRETGQLNDAARFIAEKLVPVARMRNPDPIDHLVGILLECNYYRITDKSHIAYVLATAYHESNMGRNMVERWDPAHVPEQRNYEGGNRYRGRGYVHLTHMRHYRQYTENLRTTRGLAIDLVATPERAAEPAIAAIVIAHGMRFGRFRGPKLADYGTDCNFRFVRARGIVNYPNTPREQQVARDLDGVAKRFRAQLL